MAFLTLLIINNSVMREINKIKYGLECGFVVHWLNSVWITDPSGHLTVSVLVKVLILSLSWGKLQSEDPILFVSLDIYQSVLAKVLICFVVWPEVNYKTKTLSFLCVLMSKKGFSEGLSLTWGKLQNKDPIQGSK